MNKKSLLTIVALACAIIMSAQHNHENHAESQESQEEHHEATGEHHGKHKLAIYGGFTHVQASFVEHETGEQATGKWIPTLGLDYFYTLNKTFDIGLISDIELDSYYVKEEGSTDDTHNERINVLVVTPVLKYKPLHNVGVIAGGGFEMEFAEESETLAVLKLGVEYEVPIKNGWELTPSFMADIKEEYSTASVGISLGKRF